MKFCGEVGVARGASLDFGGDPDQFPYFAPSFSPLIHFQWDNSSLKLFARWRTVPCFSCNECCVVNYINEINEIITIMK